MKARKYQEAAVSNQQIQKVKVKRLAHVGLWTSDISAQARFYCQVLGLGLRLPLNEDTEQDVDLEGSDAFLALGNEHHSLALYNDTRSTTGNGRRPVQLSPLHHIAFAVDTDAELAALAARLQMYGLQLTLSPRDGDAQEGDTLWFQDPDDNHIEILVAPEGWSARPASGGRSGSGPRPQALQHIALRTRRLEAMVEFYTEALGFDISDWMLRECAWLRCNSNHHALVIMQGQPGIEHIGYTIANGEELLHWADRLCQRRVPILWGPGRHGAGNDLFVRFTDADEQHIELSADLQQYYDHDVTSPPRLWHTRSMALNLWGVMPNWVREEVEV
ncbi:hypothetical protein EPA93_34890 [Ktedonosporobacter rubrisoli]|uniref:VOC domain-containing protein n=1 Tax=Ktedonosporobacter rubrisoli TaxID=2509675 RepID=A0A4P6JYJ9_KTERU|nr:VOC family protein [Ktedonosporobacter rubrisoli]QBD80879.1 hypothetical protein EPA93_34890 [Ktedonosporobacter rubrisoli]